MRASGVLCHVTSLPNGDLRDAERFIDFVATIGANVWQLLPITPPDEHSSPYASPSAFAGWSALCTTDEKGSIEDDSYWLEDWALFSLIRDEMNGAAWTDWPKGLRDRESEALKPYRQKIDAKISEQARFNGQWQKIHSHSLAKGVSLIGDLPIFVAHDSADVWAHRDLFLLEEDGHPSVVAGVPPDYFSEDGQRWGTVLYDWSNHEAEGWQWWRQRLARMLRLFDKVRIDHFRGLHSSWAIPAAEETARNGNWLEGPGVKLLEKLVEVAGDARCIIAEDLGIIPQEVVELRRRFEIEGMAVLHFGFSDDNPLNPHNPGNIRSDQVVYTATHDNDTTVGWWRDCCEKSKKRVTALAKTGESICETLIRIALDSPAGMAIIPLQDLLELGSDARMNTPGTTADNWKWQFAWQDLDKCCSQQLQRIP